MKLPPPPPPNYLLAGSQAILYCLASAGETLAVKALNYAPIPVVLPIYTGLLTNQLWIFMVPTYSYMWYTGKTLGYNQTYAVQYVSLGVILFLITLLRNISVNVMPGSVFALLISTSIVFNMFLTWLFLKKRFNQWHLVATCLCLSSAASIGFSALFTTQEQSSQITNFVLGIPTALCAGFFIALMSVSQEYVQGTWDDYNLRLVEMTIVSSIVASLLLLVFGFATGEIMQWPFILSLATSTLNEKVLVICVSSILPILKLVVRNTKYSIIMVSSAFFFEFVQASAALLTSVSSVILFQEPWGPGYIISFVLLLCSFVAYTYAKRVAKQQASITVPTVTTTVQDEKIIVVVANWR
jgi:drug/metabolite transporter (DMT)-like permease